MKKPERISIGLRAKTARAIAVVLGGSSESPAVLKKFEIPLADPRVPDTFQPYHVVMELPWKDSQTAVKKSVRAIETIARKAIANLIDELAEAKMKVAGIGIVGARDRDPGRIGNYHIRAHAAEGLLFRRVLDLAAEANKIEYRTFPEQDFEAILAAELGAGKTALKRKINELGKGLAPPWRTDEKQAATAAWLILHRGPR